MSDTYDDTNKGAAFTPFPEQSLILQGKLNVEGNDKRVALIKGTTKDGKSIIEIYQQVGVLFDNDKKGNESAPDFSGPFGEEKRVAGWKRTKDGKPYISFVISDKQQGAAPQQQSALPDDTIPF